MIERLVMLKLSIKNRIEKGFCVIEFIIIPHSKNKFLLDYFFIISIINMGIKIIIVAITLMMNQYNNIKYIMNDRFYIKKINKQKMYA